MKQKLFIFFKKCAALVAGKGLRKLPFATVLYQGVYRRLKPQGIVTAHADGHIFFVNAADTGIAPPLIMHGIFAPGETAALAALLKPGMAFVDVGANIGYFSLLAARAVGPRGRVYAFEPEDENYELLVKNIKANGYENVTPVKQAVSDSAGETTFYLRDDNLCAHSMVPRTGGKTVIVPTVTLDEYFKDKKVDVIKVDVEGAESSVLRGMHALLQTQKNITLVVEFYPKALRRSGADPEQFLTGLADLGFTLSAIVEEPGALPKEIPPSDFPALAKGIGIHKLVNLICRRDVHSEIS